MEMLDLDGWNWPYKTRYTMPSQQFACFKKKMHAEMGQNVALYIAAHCVPVNIVWGPW